MSGDYWLGVATPFALAVALWALATLLHAVARRLDQAGWFIETGWAPRPEVDAWSRLTRKGRGGLYLGLYRTTSGWGSRWVAIGPVTVGRKATTLGLDEKPPVEERTPCAERASRR